jgi:hypothetical protein
MGTVNPLVNLRKVEEKWIDTVVGKIDYRYLFMI